MKHKVELTARKQIMAKFIPMITCYKLQDGYAPVTMSPKPANRIVMKVTLADYRANMSATYLNKEHIK